MKKLYLIFICLCLNGAYLWGGEVNTGRFNKIAIDGYDSVAYHLVQSPMKGNSEFEAIWKKAKWHFISKNNLKLFLSNPEKYAPQYGGFCANGLSDGHKVRGNTKYWRIHNGKLYLFYSKRGRDSWDYNIEKQILLANKYWEKVKYK